MKTRNTILFAVLLTLGLSSCGKKTRETSVKRQDITEYVFASGILEPDDQYNLTAQSEGYLLELKLEEGDLLQAGQVVGVIDNRQSQVNASSSGQLLEIARQNAAPDAPALKQAEANVDAAMAREVHDEAQYQRILKLYQTQSVSRLELDNAELAYKTAVANLRAAEQQLANLKRAAEQQLIAQKSQRDIASIQEGFNRIVIVQGGKVYKRMKQTGDFVRRGEVIAVIGNPDRLHAKLSVDENNIGKVRLGQETTVQLNVEPGKALKAKVSEIKPAFDEMSQSFFIEAAFLDSLSFRISGTQLEANIKTGTKANALVVPRDYLGYGNIVRVLRDSGETKQVVKTGFVSTDWVEILEGLKEGENIITDAIK